MNFRRIDKITLLTLIWAVIFISWAYSAERIPPETYIAYSAGRSLVEITHADFSTGIENIIDTIDTSIPGFVRGVDWQIFDPMHGRIFFQEALTARVIRTRVYEIDTRRYFNLPYDNYMGQYVEMIISPHSEYILFTYKYSDDTLWSPNTYKTVVLDGLTLNQHSEKVGLNLWTETGGSSSYVTQNNKYLLNLQYISLTGSFKEHGFVVYSLPGLTPLDTIFYNRILWRGGKTPVDVSDEGILFIADRTDSIGGLPPGTYAFIYDISQRKVSSQFMPIASGGHYAAKLTPEGDEMVVVYSDSGRVRRYNLADGRMVSEIDVPQGSRFVFFGEDGNLYLRSGSEYMVVDYHNNQVLRSFNFQGK
jgi:hypothetical protein